MAFPPPINLSDPGIELVSPALQADFFYHWATRESLVSEDDTYKKIFPFLISSVQFHSHVCTFVHPLTAAYETSLCIINSQGML